MKKFLFTICTLLIVLCTFTSCRKNHSDIVKITDYLYEAYYTDLYDEVMTLMSDSSNAFISAKAACSSVRNGNFHGRSFDLFYNDMCECVVHVAKSDKRFASLAVCGGNPEYTPEKLADIGEEEYAIFPFGVLDGINENGVVFNLNVVPGDDTAPSKGTNPGKEDLSFAVAGRYILDHATSAKHAVELLQDRNMLGCLGEYGLHYMISDPKETYIVEFLDNKLVYYRGEAVCDSNVMTNLFSTLLPEITPHGSGIERYALLQEHYAEGSTLEGMAKLMQRVKYTNTYDLSYQPFWYSEYVAKQYTNDTPKEDLMKIAEYCNKDFQRHKRDGTFWHSVHTSVYDIQNKTLRLYVQEDFDHPFNFKLSDEVKKQ